MCGIGGILFSTDRSEVLSQRMTSLNRSQQHRGPDEQTMLVTGCHAFCHQRLALIDAAGGHQPFTDSSGRYHIVYNGELYNYKELKSQLEAQYVFTTQSDTEVLLAAWIIWGEDCLGRLNGMFAFLIWDTLRSTGFAARDPVGVKPFVYHYDSPVFYFASEVKALLTVLPAHPGLNEYALSELLIAPSLSGGGSEALLAGIRYLEPGCFLRIDRDGLQIRRYYTFNWHTDQLSGQALITTVGTAIEESVRLSLRADLPIGIFLSGGLDSSLIAAIAAKHADYAPQAYTICFDNHQQVDFDPATIVNSDDLPFARELAGQLRLPFHEVSASHIAQHLRLLARINDRSPVWEQEFSQHVLAQAASRQHKAVLVGDAADETNYGYFFLLNPDVNPSPAGLINRFGGDFRELALHPDLRRRLKPMAYLQEQYCQLALDAGYTFGRSPRENILAMSTLIHQRWLQRLLHNGDIHTMHFGLEARVPFANRNMLEAAALVYPEAGFKNNTEKYVLRKAAEKWLPAGLAHRKKSSLPRDPRFGQEYQRILRTLLDQKNSFADRYLSRPALDQLCRQTTLEENQRMLLFTIICLIYWAEEYAK